MSSKEATVVVPVYNEADGVRESLQELLAPEFLERFEVILVDDGSTDGTSEILDEMAAGRDDFLLIHHEENRGYGASLKTGVIEAGCEWIVITDADCSYPNHRIPELVEMTKAGRYDMVVGARTMAGAKIPLIRRPAKWVLNKLANYLARRRIPDLNSGLRVFRRTIAMDHLGLLSDQFSFTTGITLVMLCNNFRVKYEPIEYYARSGKSKIRPIRDTLRFLGLILTTSYTFRPLRVLLPPAMVLLLAGLGWGLYQALALGNVTTAAMLLVQTGFMILVLALVSDLVVRSRSIRHVQNRSS